MGHLIATLIAQIAYGLATSDWLTGGVFAAALFVGREHAQAEYRWIERYGLGLRANMPWTGGFQPRVWNTKSILDWALPCAGVAVLWAIV